MSEKLNERTIFSLLEVTGSIQRTLNDRYKSSFWVKAEMNKLNLYKYSGHCYPELVEKRDDKVIAQMRSVLWKSDFDRINDNFQTVLKEPLKDGIKILFLAKINFDPIHGISLTILDIDPSYTLGDLEKEKADTIHRLKLNKLFDLNKRLPIALLPQRIAIISVETSKGYADFIDVIDKNPWKYKFFYMLFPALLQGDKAAADITGQLRRIQHVANHFDVVAIIRGGGGDVGLSCYNNFELARVICEFPLPVITGIGHSTNETVSEMVSFANAITPTKLAEFLIQKFHNFAVPVRDGELKIAERSRRLIADEKRRFQTEIKLFKSVTEGVLSSNRNDLKNSVRYLLQETQFKFRTEREYFENVRNNLIKGKDLFMRDSAMALRERMTALTKDSRIRLSQEKSEMMQLKEKLDYLGNTKIKSANTELHFIEKQIQSLSPENVLRRGYSITTCNGKVLTSLSGIDKGDFIKTELSDGHVISIVESKQNKTVE